ncbi:MAG: bifunctional nuclease family protein [Planctomycetota bacterium]|jgi:bifunctional DNase/RNase
MIEVRVSRLVIVDDHQEQFIQLREASPEGNPRELTMVIGPSEAYAISYCLEGARPQRPLTYELAFQLIGALDGQLTEAVIHDLREHTYFAELHIEHQGTTLRVDCRPSDAIALSLRGSSPIYVTENVFTTAQGGS